MTDLGYKELDSEPPDDRPATFVDDGSIMEVTALWVFANPEKWSVLSSRKGGGWLATPNADLFRWVPNPPVTLKAPSFWYTTSSSTSVTMPQPTITSGSCVVSYIPWKAQ